VRARRPLIADHDGTREIWPAFTDVMSTLALILFVIVLLSYVRSLISAKQLDAFQHQIASSQQELRSLRIQIDAEQRELAYSKAKVEEQGAALAASDKELEAVRDQLQSIAVLRLGVLQKLQRAIEAQMGPRESGAPEAVTIGDTGNIVINEKLVFEYDSYAVKPEARPLLDSLARALGAVLDDPDVRANIDTIVIQGHTDERGSTAVNWDLSAKRATAVLNYLFDANESLARSYGSYFSASAYSKFRPINPAKTEEAYQQNRRIELAVVPKDDNVRKVVDEYLNAQHPAGVGAPAASTPAPP
jgi:chemotaxis protein MotB